MITIASIFTVVGCTGTEPESTPVPTIVAGVGSDVTVVSQVPGTTDDTVDPLSFPAYSDPDARIITAIGRHFALMLDADPSSGFHWTVVSPFDPAIVTPLGTQFMTTSTAIAGNPDSQILSFVGVGEGTTEIILHYGPAAGGSSAETREVAFTVTVTYDGQPPPSDEEPSNDSDGLDTGGLDTGGLDTGDLGANGPGSGGFTD